MAGRPKKRARDAREAVKSMASPPVARDHSAVPNDREERFRYILGMFADCSWSPGKSDIEIAEAWGCDSSTVRHISAEAGRFFRLEPQFKIQLRTNRAMLCMRLLDLADRAKLSGDGKTEATALDLYGEYAGLRPSRRTEVTGKDGGPLALKMVPLEDIDDLRKTAEANARPECPAETSAANEPSSSPTR